MIGVSRTFTEHARPRKTRERSLQRAKWTLYSQLTIIAAVVTYSLYINIHINIHCYSSTRTPII